MFIIPRRKVRASQPQQAVGIDWSNPLVRAARIIYVVSAHEGGMAKIYWNRGEKNTTTPISGVCASGRRTGVVGGGWSSTAASGGFPNNSRSHFSISHFGNQGSDYRTLGQSTGGGFYGGTSSGVRYGVRTYNGVFYTPYIAVPFGIVSAWGTWDQPNNIGTLHIDGYAPQTIATTSTWDVNNDVLDIGGTQETGLVLGFCCAGVVPENIRKQLSANPWQIFKDEEDYLFIPPIAGGDPASITGTLSATLDSINTDFQLALNHSGTGSVSLSDISCILSATLGQSGSSVISLEDISATVSGSVSSAGSVTGALSVSLADIVTTVAGSLDHSGSLTSSLADVFVSMAGTVAGTPENITGTLAITLDGIGFISSGSSGTVTLTADDIIAIKNAIMSDPKMLTVPKFLALK